MSLIDTLNAAANNIASRNSDADCIPRLVKIGSTTEGINAVQAKAAKTMASIGYKWPKKSCAATLSHFLREAGINIPITTGAQKLADRLRLNRGWTRVDVGEQKPGDVGVCYSMADDVPGADHVYLVVEAKDRDVMVIADNQRNGENHLRSAAGRDVGEGGKTPTEYFLRAPTGPQAMGAGNNLSGIIDIDNLGFVDDDNPNSLPEPYMDDGSPRLMNPDGSARIVE